MLTTRLNLGRNDIRNAALVVGSEWKGQVGGNEEMGGQYLDGS